MRVMGIVGSPRRGGNTDILVGEVLRGAASAGAQTERVFLADLNIAPCRACEGCHQDGFCAQSDDMIPLTERLLDTEVWVLGTPVYWWGPSAQMKAFIDRWYAPEKSPERKARMRKRVALVAPFADEDPATPRHLVGMVAAALDWLQAEFAGQLLVTADASGEVAGNQRALQEAFALGQALVERPR